jgi:transposase-like protein
MQTPKEAVSTAIRLKTKSPMSAETVMEEVGIIYGIKRCASVIYYWINKFSEIFAAINDMPLYGISKRLHWDYTYLKINGEDAYLWALKCPHTGLASWLLTMTRTIEDAKASLYEARRHFPIGYELAEIVSDGEQSFPRAIWEVFEHSVKHYRYKGFVDKRNNNSIENLWNLKDQIPEFRTFEQAVKFFTRYFSLYSIKRSKRIAESDEVCELEEMIKISTCFTIQVL